MKSLVPIIRIQGPSVYKIIVFLWSCFFLILRYHLTALSWVETQGKKYDKHY